MGGQRGALEVGAGGVEQQDLAPSPAVGRDGEVKEAKGERNKVKGKQGDGNNKTSQMRGQVEGGGCQP